MGTCCSPAAAVHECVRACKRLGLVGTPVLHHRQVYQARGQKSCRVRPSFCFLTADLSSSRILNIYIKTWFFLSPLHACREAVYRSRATNCAIIKLCICADTVSLSGYTIYIQNILLLCKESFDFCGSSRYNKLFWLCCCCVSLFNLVSFVICTIWEKTVSRITQSKLLLRSSWTFGSGAISFLHLTNDSHKRI